MATAKEIAELRDLYENSKKLLTRRKKTLHRARMLYRKAIKRKKQREAITARKKRKWLDAKDGGRERAVRWALSQVGVHETPGKPNQGPEVDRWNAAVGMSPGPYAYWCGSFVHAALKAGGLDFPDWMRYVPTVLSMAQRGECGLSVRPVSDLKPGDLVVMNFDGGVPDHIELYIGDGDDVGGNTSPGTGGSQSNGGGVYVRQPRGVATGVHVNYSKAPKKQAGVERH